jgi:hypothetical protein
MVNGESNQWPSGLLVGQIRRTMQLPNDKLAFRLQGENCCSYAVQFPKMARGGRGAQDTSHHPYIQASNPAATSFHLVPLSLLWVESRAELSIAAKLSMIFSIQTTPSVWSKSSKLAWHVTCLSSCRGRPASHSPWTYSSARFQLCAVLLIRRFSCVGSALPLLDLPLLLLCQVSLARQHRSPPALSRAEREPPRRLVFSGLHREVDKVWRQSVGYVP